MHDSDDFVDRLLDASLAGYAAAEPRPGLEQRILARLAGEPQPAAWPGWRWLPVGALAVGALLAAVLLLPRDETAPAPPTIGSQPVPVTPSTAPTAMPPPAPVVATARPALPRARAPQFTTALARAQQFPRAGTLTEEERHLMSYLNSTPHEVLVAAVRSDAGNNRPIPDLLVRNVEVPLLELKPLPEQSGEAMEN
jgi:hypothetical protein